MYIICDIKDKYAVGAVNAKRTLTASKSPRQHHHRPSFLPTNGPCFRSLLVRLPLVASLKRNRHGVRLALIVRTKGVGMQQMCAPGGMEKRERDEPTLNREIFEFIVFLQHSGDLFGML